MFIAGFHSRKTRRCYQCQLFNVIINRSSQSTLRHVWRFPRLYVLVALQPRVLEGGNSSGLINQPGIRQTLKSIRRRFWSTATSSDVHSFPPALSASYAYMTMVPDLSESTSLPSSEGNTMYFSLWFSKAASSQEEACLIVQHVYRLHGLPQDFCHPVLSVQLTWPDNVENSL